jgi:hypothetical protein
MHGIIIVLLIKASSRNAIGKKMWQYLGLLMLPVCKECRKTFTSMSRIRPVTTRPAVLYSQWYLVVSVIHIQSLCSHICGHIHVLHNIQTLIWPKK